LAEHRIEWNEQNSRPATIPLYSSGAEACRAGLAGVRRPSIKAEKVIAKLVRAKTMKITRNENQRTGRS
jgi:hypothetical protein